MTSTATKNRRRIVAHIVLAAALFGSAGVNLAHAKPAEGYVPFVTDFPRAEEPYVPFVTDFPRPATPSDAPGPAADGIDWAAVGLEGGVGAALAALLASGALVLARRRQPRTAPSC